MNTRQQAALTHLRLVGRDVRRDAAYALGYGLTADQIREAISEGVNQAEREEGPDGQTKVERSVREAQRHVLLR